MTPAERRPPFWDRLVSAAGVDPAVLTSSDGDRTILDWLAGWDEHTTVALEELFTKIRAAQVGKTVPDPLEWLYKRSTEGAP